METVMPRLELLPERFKPNAKDFEPMKEKYYIIDWLDEKSVVRISCGIFSFNRYDLVIRHTGSECDGTVNDHMIFVAEVILD